jgi:hypothetical protein
MMLLNKYLYSFGFFVLMRRLLRSGHFIVFNNVL